MANHAVNTGKIKLITQQADKQWCFQEKQAVGTYILINYSYGLR